jgi:hypothetical protein
MSHISHFRRYKALSGRQPMMQPIRHLLLAICIFVMPSMNARAQTTQEPSLITIPSIPIANRPFKVEATFFGPTTPCLFEVSEYFGFGQPGLILIACDIEAPRQWVTQELTIPGQHAGPYEVSFASPGFSPEPTYANFAITVADAPPSAVPGMTTVGAGICVVSLALFGVITSRRRRTYKAPRSSVRVSSRPPSK